MSAIETSSTTLLAPRSFHVMSDVSNPVTRIAILTGRSVNPFHARTEMMVSVLLDEGYEVNLISAKLKATSWLSRLMHRANLGAFDFESPFRHWREMRGADIVMVHDMRLVIAVLLEKLLGKKTVYEACDNYPNLHFAALCSNMPFFKHFPLVRTLVSATERTIVALCADETIVNSKALHEWFGPRSEIVYYSSPFESVVNEYRAELPPALLYLGLVSRQKSAEEMLELQRRFNVPFYIFGEVDKGSGLERQLRGEKIHWETRLESSELKERFRQLTSEHALIGLSLVKPTNFSYATQEANKDIDYLALGLPIIGSSRGPTLEKIEAGCGACITDGVAVAEVFDSNHRRAEYSCRSIEYYRQHYAKKYFADGLLKVMKRLAMTDDN